MKRILSAILAVSALLLACTASSQTLPAWQALNGPWGGYVTSMETFDGYLWANTREGGVYRSANNGTSWEAHNQGIQLTALDATNDLHAAGGKLFLATKAQGVLRLDAANGTWTTVLAGHFYSVISQGSALFAAKYEAPFVYKSIDGGTTWTVSSTGLTLPPYPVYGLGASSGYLIATCFSSAAGGIVVYRSADAGTTWTPATTPNIPTAQMFHRIRTIGNKIFLFYYTYAQSYLPTYTTDGGLTWATVPNTTNNSMAFDDILEISGRYVGLNSYYLLDFNKTGAAAVAYPAPNEKYSRMNDGFFQSGNKLFLMGDRLLAGDTSLRNFGFSDSLMKAFPASALTGKGTRLLVQPAANTIAATNNAGLSWSADSLHAKLGTATFKGTDWYIGGWNTGVFKSTDGGYHFKEINTGISTPGLSPVVNVLHTTAGNAVYTNDRNKLYQLQPGDSSWALLYTFPGLTPPQEADISCLASGGGYLFAGTSGGPGGFGDKCYRSSDGGTTWTDISPNLAYTTTDALAVFNGKVYLANNSYGVFASSNWGNTWTEADSGIVTAYNAVPWVKTLSTIGTRLYGIVHYDNDLYQLDAGSNTWVNLTPNATDPQVISVWGASDSLLFVGTANNGIWKRQISPNTNPTGWEPVTNTLGATLCGNPGSRPQLSVPNPAAWPAQVKVVAAGTGKVVATVTVAAPLTVLDLAVNPGLYILHITAKNGASAVLKWVKDR